MDKWTCIYDQMLRKAQFRTPTLPANSLEIILTYFANLNSKNPKAHIEFLVKFY